MRVRVREWGEGGVGERAMEMIWGRGWQQRGKEMGRGKDCRWEVGGGVEVGDPRPKVQGRRSKVRARGHRMRGCSSPKGTVVVWRGKQSKRQGVVESLEAGAAGRGRGRNSRGAGGSLALGSDVLSGAGKVRNDGAEQAGLGGQQQGQSKQEIAAVRTTRLPWSAHDGRSPI